MKLRVAICILSLPWLDVALGGVHPEVLAFFEGLCGVSGGAMILRAWLRKALPASFAGLLALAMFAVAIGDLLCGMEFIHQGDGKVATRGAGEACYALFWTSAFLGLMFRGGWRALVQSPLLTTVFGIVFAAFVWLQIEFVLPAQHPAGVEPTFAYAVHWLWIMAKAAGAAAALVSSLIAVSAFDFCLTHALGAMAVASLSTAYHAAAANYREFCLAEPLWATALAAVGLSLTLIGQNSTDAASHYSPARSLRVWLGTAVFLANCVVLMAVVGLGVTQVQTAFQATAIGFALYASWFAANAVAFYTTVELARTSSRLPRPRSSVLMPDGDVRPMVVPPVPARPLMQEFDRLAEDYRQLAAQTNDLVASLVQMRGAESSAKIAARVAHDIRSPLAALNVIVKEIDAMPEAPRSLARAAIERIQDIASGLLREVQAARGEAPPKPVATMLRPIIDEVLAEKRLTLQCRCALNLVCSTPAAYGVFVTLLPAELARTLSNLINNAVEALADGGCVSVGVKHEGERLQVEVADDGAGIPADRLALLGGYGVTFGKEEGSGIGLHEAFEFARSAGGNMAIQSTVGRGTRVTLCLPSAQPPGWFVECLTLAPHTRVVVLDGDLHVHLLWRERFERAGRGEVEYWSTPRNATTEEMDSVIYLVGSSFFGSAEAGLAFVRDLEAGHMGILVLARDLERELLPRCEAAGVSVIPRDLIPILPIQLLEHEDPLIVRGDGELAEARVT